MSHAFKIIFALIILGVGISADQEIKKEFKMKSGKTLTVDLETGGSILIKGWDENRISVVAFLDGRDCDDCDFEMKENSSGLEITSEFSRRRNHYSCDVDVEIQVPKKFNVDLKTNGGRLDVSNIEGDLRGKTNGGGLSLSDLKGDIDFHTNGGRVDCDKIYGKADITTNGGGIDCSNSEFDGRIHTNGGSIDLDNVSGDIDCTTNGGRVRYDDDESFKPLKTRKVVNINTKGGDIDVDSAPMGADVHTNGGNITIGEASEFVIAHTNGGEIYLSKVDGSVKAHTNGGDVKVEITGKETGKNRNIELSSNGGEITLILPPDFSASFDISLAYTKNSRRNYSIISDFDIRTRESNDWNYDRGTPRKYIDGSGEINGGKNRIEIKTVNGDIKVKKS